MKFSRLRLLGFKSFVEPCEFIIEHGLTGIVGPNGCGKSNLVEALRWVMGESSYKNMRASGMDDVIFSGSGSRPARNTAEVTLFLDNSDRTAPPAFNDADELQVSRRIEREAGSLYRINGKEARARDVQLLFADQSTGARSPSMVGQGRIGELIAAKPQARRALLEEAAGISGLHSRRHEAELRLRGAEQNLERLDDVVGELEGQVESLKRQARQASRFKNLSADIRKAEAVLLHLRWSVAKAQEAETALALTEATSQVGARAAAQVEAAKAQAIAAHKLPQLREAEAAAAAGVQRLSIANAQLDEEAQRVRLRQSELHRRLEQLDADIAREERMVVENADILERLAEEEAQLAKDTARADGRSKTMQQAVEDAAERLGRSEAELARLTAERAESAAFRTQIERSLREVGERRDRFTRQLGEMDRELAQIAARLAALPDPAEKHEWVEQAEDALEAAQAIVATCEEAVAQAREVENKARGPLQDVRGQLAAIETEARTLARMLHADGSDRFSAILEEISVKPGFEAALGAALGEDLEAPLDPDAPAYWSNIAPVADDPPLPEGVKNLGSVVQAPCQLARRLAQIGIIEPHEGAVLQPSLAPGQQLVTRDGALWRWDGFVASADAPTMAALRLAQKNRLTELEAEAIAATVKLHAAEEVLGAAEAAIYTHIEAERTARQSLRDTQIKLDEARAALAQAQRAEGEITSRRAVLEDARQRVMEELEEISALYWQAEEAQRTAPDPGDLQARFEQASAEVFSDRTGLAEARAVHEGLNHEAQARARRLQAIEAERRNWLMRLENADSHIRALQERRAEVLEEREALVDAPDEFELRRRQLLSRLAQAQASRNEAADQLQEAENEQKALDGAAASAIQGLAEAREVRARTEERLTAAEQRRQEIEARIQEALNTPPHLVIRHTGLQSGDPMPDPVNVERTLERLKIERERLGAVNLRAEEEQRELTGRLQDIITERDDIIEAIRKLRQAILSLNREGRERLLAAFEVVNSHFQRLFTHLFGGGTAQLQLVESDDPLEAGLEILARPPGKKPQTMTLLSGGEQALTAMSLIFAVFLTNPAPICVLDEVDAPLDDHNVERFCNLMDEMAASTQTRFIIITHNPITMARMDRLFGVTMAEQGVSQLVSVDLQQAETMRDAG
ncbi:chromosome segregation protein SMC [Aquamicrobium segne]|uniref:Chromosome partition protein Smc n=1 Tax=Aquamicrobium segne TaxID=469547 RepID=A0ABW0GXQ9_9HYPH